MRAHNAFIGIVVMSSSGIVALVLVVQGIVGGLIRRRLPRPYRRGEYYEGNAAIAQGVLRIVAGCAALALIVAVLLGKR